MGTVDPRGPGRGISRGPGWRILRFLSGISLRILFFNVLVVFLPVAGFLLIGTYERQLLRSLEHALVQQGRVLAAALSDRGPAMGDEAVRVIRGLRMRHEARLRVLDAAGSLLADSSRLGGTGGEAASIPADAGPEAARPAEETLLYRLASWPVRAARRIFRPPVPALENADYYTGARRFSGQEVLEALSGRYGAATRISSGGERSVTLYSAIPIQDGTRTVGAVLVSQSTYRILSDLYDIRLDVFTVFLVSVATAVVLSLLVSATISVPILRLREHARRIVDGRGRLVVAGSRGGSRGAGRRSAAGDPPAGARLPAGFPQSRRRDEIGDLSRSLEELTQRLEKHLHFVESFASDVSHELKNPLASIRSAAELAATAQDGEERARFFRMIQEDIRRMESLLSAVRDITRIDAEAPGPGTGPADPAETARRIAESFRRRSPGGLRFSVAAGPGDHRVGVPPERLAQVLENLLDNAAGFSPPGGVVEVAVVREGGETVIAVSDDGPGIPAEHRERVFDRFFSWRPQGDAGGRHAGLGLSIVKAIVEGCGGSVRAGARRDGAVGARVEARLPRWKGEEG